MPYKLRNITTQITAVF